MKKFSLKNKDQSKLIKYSFTMEDEIIKPKIMLHIIMPNQVSGPNTASKLIYDSYLSEKYDFQFLTQHKHAGGKLNFSLIRDLVKQIKKFDPDIVHLTGLQSAGFHAVVAAKLCNKKVLLVVRGSSIDALNLSLKMRFIFGKFIEPLTLRLANSIYTVCKAMEQRDFIKKHTTKRLIGTIHNSAPIITQSSLVEYNVREKLGIAQDEMVVVIVGRMVFDKGITYISDAIKEIKSRKISFIFIGDEPTNGGILKILKEEIFSNRVFLLGKQEKENVLSILNESDVFLFATLHENLSNALLEACSLGLAVIATNVGGNPEIIRNNYNGLLIPPKDSNAIVESLILLSENKEMRQMFGSNAKKNVEENFSQSVLLEKVSAVYQNLIFSK